MILGKGLVPIVPFDAGFGFEDLFEVFEGFFEGFGCFVFGEFLHYVV